MHGSNHSMFNFPDIEPVVFTIGPLQVHWYGVMYLLSFIGGYWLLHYRARTRPLTRPVDPQQVGDLIFYLALGVVLAPSELGITLVCEPSITATQELVVPRSMPITFAMLLILSDGQPKS